MYMIINNIADFKLSVNSMLNIVKYHNHYDGTKIQCTTTVGQVLIKFT